MHTRLNLKALHWIVKIGVGCGSREKGGQKSDCGGPGVLR